MIKRIIYNKIFLAAFLLIIGIAIGYLIREINAQFISETIDKFGSRFSSSFSPTPSFLTDVAAFEAVVIAIAVPLSFEMITRLSDRYETNVFTWKFFDNWIIRGLPILLLINILLAIGLRFFVNDTPSSSIWKILAWLAFVGFIAMTILFALFILIFKRGMNPQKVLSGLYDEADRILNEAI